MILDANLALSTDQQITADAVSENTIDLGDVTPKRRIGAGEVLGVGVFVKLQGTHTGSMVLELIESAAANLGSPVVVASLTLINAEILAGQKFFVAIPPGQTKLRYLGLNYNITGTVDFTVDAFLMPQSQFESSHLVAKGYTIS
jgi:hypothetical protein